MASDIYGPFLLRRFFFFHSVLCLDHTATATDNSDRNVNQQTEAGESKRHFRRMSAGWNSRIMYSIARTKSSSKMKDICTESGRNASPCGWTTCLPSDQVPIALIRKGLCSISLLSEATGSGRQPAATAAALKTCEYKSAGHASSFFAFVVYTRNSLFRRSHRWFRSSTICHRSDPELPLIIPCTAFATFANHLYMYKKNGSAGWEGKTQISCVTRLRIHPHTNIRHFTRLQRKQS